jgi:hypothetical protein
LTRRSTTTETLFQPNIPKPPFNRFWEKAFADRESLVQDRKADRLIDAGNVYPAGMQESLGTMTQEVTVGGKASGPVTVEMRAKSPI